MDYGCPESQGFYGSRRSQYDYRIAASLQRNVYEDVVPQAYSVNGLFRAYGIIGAIQEHVALVISV